MVNQFYEGDRMAPLKRTVKTSKNRTSKTAVISRKTVKTSAPQTIKKTKKVTKNNASGKAHKPVTADQKKKSPAKIVTAKPATLKSKAAKPVPIAGESKKTSQPKKKLTEREERLYKIKLHLMRQRTILLNGAGQALNEQLPGQTIFPDLGDQATAETDRNFMLRLRGREQRLLNKIDEAIERIDSGTFGICDDCGNDIDIKRLEVRPVTTMCIECKTLQEEDEKLREN